jgi:hypothetical protein
MLHMNPAPRRPAIGLLGTIGALLALCVQPGLLRADDPWPAPSRPLPAPSPVDGSSSQDVSQHLGSRLVVWRDRQPPTPERVAPRSVGAELAIEKAAEGVSPALRQVPGVLGVRAGRHAGLPALFVLVDRGVSAVALEGLLQGRLAYPVVVRDADPASLISRP